MSCFKITIVLILAAFSIVVVSHAINITQFFEKTCNSVDGFKTANFNNWMRNLTSTRFYYPLLSGLHIARFSQNFFRQADLTFLSLNDLLGSCVTVQFAFDGRTTETLRGYCDKTNVMVNILTPPNNVTYWNNVFPQGEDGYFWISLSDNESWVVVTGCWGDGQHSFAVLSRTPELLACDQEIITAHLKALGFSEKFFVQIRYNKKSCACTHSAKPEI